MKSQDTISCAFVIALLITWDIAKLLWYSLGQSPVSYASERSQAAASWRSVHRSEQNPDITRTYLRYLQLQQTA